MNYQASYLRARIQTFRELISRAGQDEEKNSPRELLKYGVIHPDMEAEFHEELQYELHKEHSNEPLSFTEICSFNTWFFMHPQKIAGEEIITSSREFPITIKGTQEQVIQTIKPTANSNTKRIRIIRDQAQAKLKLLQLLEN